MQQHRIISLASILVMLIIPVIGWFLVAQPQLAAASQADQQRSDMQAQIDASRIAVAQLKADTAQLPKLNDELNTLRTSIPAGVDSSGYIDGLDAIAQLNGVKIKGLTVSDPVVYAPATPPGAVAPPADASADGAEPAPESTAAPVVVDPAIVTNPLIDSTSFVAIPVSVEVAGTFSAVLSFVDGLQSSPRLFLVTSLDTSDAGDGSGVTGSISGYIYAIPTGVEGKPHPISTTVKSMVAAEPPADETDGTADGTANGSTDEPDPGETDAPTTP